MIWPAVILHHLRPLMAPQQGAHAWSALELDDVRYYTQKLATLDNMQCLCCGGYGHNAYSCGTKAELDRFWAGA